MRAVYNERIVRPDKGFTIYFLLMFCCYTNTYIQLLSQIGILAYVFLPVLKCGRIYMKKMKQLPFYLGWYGLFTFLMYVSKYWAYSTYEGSKTMITVFRICVIGIAVFYYVDCKEKAISVFQSFIIGCAIMGALAIITTILSGGVIGTTTFGKAIGQHRNQIGAVSAPLVIMCYCMSRTFRLRYGIALTIYFLILTICTGSRTSMLQIILVFALYILCERRASKKIQHLALFALTAVIGIAVIQSVPILYDTIWVRIENAINTVLGLDVSDTSALGRDYYKAIAFLMFIQKPLYGFGVDGFVCFLRDNPLIMGRYLAPVYSHCNYAELAADFGILGLIVWYLPVLTVLCRVAKYRKKGSWQACLFSVFASFILTDYSRFPWDTHLVMYMFFCVILLINYEHKESFDSNRMERAV